MASIPSATEGFLAITRGDGFSSKRILPTFLLIAGAMAAGYAILYGLSYWLTLDFSYGIHDAWSLCMSAAGPILVGCAVYLRFNSVLVVAIGFVYAFIQPVAYALDLQVAGTPAGDKILQYEPVVDITLGGLKILWAVFFMQILAHGEGGGGSSLVAETNNPGLLGEWDRRTLGHALLLGSAYVFLLVAMLMTFDEQKQKQIEAFGVAFGIVMGLIGLIDIGLRLWKEILKDKPGQARGARTA